MKIHATSNLHETLSIISPSDESMVYHIAWNNEGSLLALTTARGALQVHVARLHPMGATCAPTIAILSSIAEITIYQHYGNKVFIYRKLFFFIISKLKLILGYV